MRLALSVLVLLLALPAFLPVSAQVPLGADLDNAVTIYEGPTELYMQFRKGQMIAKNDVLAITIPPDDVERLCSIADYVYVIVEYSNPDSVEGRVPVLQLEIPGVRSYSWRYAQAAQLRASVSWVVDCNVLEKADWIRIRLGFNGRLDRFSINDRGGVTIERVLLAPPEAVKAASTPATPTTTVVVARLSGDGGSQDDRRSLVLMSVAVAAVFAVAAFVAGMFFGKKAAAILLLLMLPMALPIVGVAQTNMSAIMLSGAGTLTIPPNTTVRLGSSQPVILLFNETAGLKIKIVWSDGRTITVSANNVTLGGDYVVEIDTSGRAEPLEVSYVEISKPVLLAGGEKIFEGKITVSSRFVHVNVEPGKEYKIVVESVGDIWLRYIAVWDGYVEPPKDQVFWPRSKAESLGDLLYFGVVADYDMIKVRPERSTITIAISIGVHDAYWKVEVYGEGGGGGGHGPKPQPTYTPPYTQPRTVTETQTVTQTIVQQEQLSGSMDTKTLLYLVGGALAIVFFMLLTVVVIVLGRGR